MGEKLSKQEVLIKLVGPITPCGDSNIDKIRLENLEELIEITENSITNIISVARYYQSYEYSVAVIGNRANKFITELKDMLNE